MSPVLSTNLADAIFDQDVRLAPKGSFSGGPILGVVLGSGLGGLADQIESAIEIPFSKIPGLPQASAAGHRGEFISGTFHGVPMLAMAGRLHGYEGHDLATMTRPIRVMRAAGVTHLIISCAAGGLNPRFSAGDIAILDETISWIAGAIGRQPVVSEEFANFPAQPRPRPDRLDQAMADVAVEIAREQRFTLHRATYLAVHGPNYETRAECRMMRTLGVDVVGMSTVPECIAAAALGLRILPLAVVTNMAIPDAPVAAAHDDVLEVSRHAGDRLQHIVAGIAARMIAAGEPRS